MARIEDLRRIPVHESLTKRRLLFGCERIPLLIVIIGAMIPATIIFVVGDILLPLVILDIAWIVLGLGLLKMMALYDPYFFDAVVRHISYQPYYLAYEGYPGYSSAIYNPVKSMDSSEFTY